MHPLELNNMVYVAARFGANHTMGAGLYRKVRALTGPRPSIRLICAATIFHIWLLRGRPDKSEWRYRQRVLYSIEVLKRFLDLPDEDRRNTGLEQPPASLPGAYVN